MSSSLDFNGGNKDINLTRIVSSFTMSYLCEMMRESFLRYKLLFNLLIHCHQENLTSGFSHASLFLFENNEPFSAFHHVLLFVVRIWNMMNEILHSHNDSFLNICKSSVLFNYKLCFLLTSYISNIYMIDIHDLQIFYVNYHKDKIKFCILLFLSFFCTSIYDINKFE